MHRIYDICNNLLTEYDNVKEYDEVEIEKKKELLKKKHNLSKAECSFINDTFKHIKNKINMRRGEEQLLKRAALILEVTEQKRPDENMQDQKVQNDYMDEFEKIYKEEKARWKDTPLNRFSVLMLLCTNELLWERYLEIVEEEEKVFR